MFVMIITLYITRSQAIRRLACPWFKFVRFLSDPDLGGCEKISVSLPTSGMCAHRPPLTVADVTGATDGADLVEPMALLIVKGWTRCFALWFLMACAWESEEYLKARCG